MGCDHSVEYGTNDGGCWLCREEALEADLDESQAQVKKLEERRDEHLRLIRQISTESVNPEEADDLRSQIAALIVEVGTLRSLNRNLKQWVADLHSGMYINCVYCGHRYGPTSEVPATKADMLKRHISKCPEHPLSKALEGLRWVALQTCTFDAEGASDDTPCTETEACLTEYCLSCYAQVVLRSEFDE